MEGMKVVTEYVLTIPETKGDLNDHLGFMMLSSPTFIDKTGYFPTYTIDTAFIELNEGLSRLRKRLGEERYLALREMSDRMRALFEADPEDVTGDAKKGRRIILEMEELLLQSKKPRS